MFIESMTITGLFGHLNKSITFNKDYSLLVGINGSGKTTILNIINWLLLPSFPDLCSTKFESIELLFYIEDLLYRITCEQNEIQLKYNLSIGNQSFEPLIAPLDIDPSTLKTSFKKKLSFKQKYSFLGPDESEMETWKAIQKIPNPVLLGIDRVRRQANVHINKEGEYESPSSEIALEYIAQSLRNAFNQSNASVLSLIEQIKSRLMLYAFDFIYDINKVFYKSIAPPSGKEIETVEKRILELIEPELVTADRLDRVKEYFAQLKRIGQPLSKQSSTPEEKLNYLFNIKQFEKVRSVLKDFQEFEEKKSESTRKTDSFLQIMNDFLKDSNKELYYNTISSDVEYRVFDKQGNVIEEGLDLHYLSSGEQQILVLFATLMFESSSQVFLIDEPELSLHVKWLEMLIPHLESIFPPNQQLIIATHSPILADWGRNNAILLYPY